MPLLVGDGSAGTTLLPALSDNPSLGRAGLSWDCQWDFCAALGVEPCAPWGTFLALARVCRY